MEQLQKIQKKKRISYFVIMAIMLVMLVIPVVVCTSQNTLEPNSVIMDEGWEVTVNGNVNTNIKLSEYRFNMCNKGDIVVLRHVIPKYDSIVQPALGLYSIHSAIKVSIDNEVIYQYGQERYRENKMLGYGKHFVPIRSNEDSKILTIECKVAENSAFDGLQAIVIVDGENYIIRDIMCKRFSLAISMFLIVFGVIIMILSMFMLKSSANFVQTFCIAMFSFIVGIWTICNRDLIEYITPDLLIKSYLEYMSFYLLPIPFTYYFRDRLQEKNFPKWLKVFFWTLLGIEILFVISICTMQFFNIIHLPQVLEIAHTIMVLALIFIISINIWSRKHGDRTMTSVMTGFGIAVLLICIELVRFNLNKFVFGFENNEYSSITCFAVLTIVIALLVDYGRSISQTLYISTKQSLLEQMAYMDELTGLANRRKCEEKLKELENTSKDYSIISFDLNFLKRVNDTYGHEKGDELIKKFADVLREVYSLYGVIARTGGDEFITILEDVSLNKVESLIQEMIELIEKKNKEDDILKLSTAYGYAMSNEAFSKENAGRTDSEINEQYINPHYIYRIADDRMYENKRKSKMGRKD